MSDYRESGTLPVDNTVLWQKMKKLSGLGTARPDRRGDRCAQVTIRRSD